ncbi:MAG: helix-turn-helix transcriptional regulator [Lachnospiraceae bacterium]|nr:helix-turn-helix transcriptional regulator [Lachnospiraceae bacterium]
MNKEFNFRVGENIYNIRKRLGLTRAQFSERCDISEGFLAAVESGAKSMRAEILLKISRGAGVSADFLLNGEAKDENQLFLEFAKQLSPEEGRQAMNLLVTYMNSLYDLKIKADRNKDKSER